MKSLIACAVTVLLAASALNAQQFPQRWNYLSCDLKDDKAADKAVETLKLSKEAHCTHILFSEWNNTRQAQQPPEYFKRVERIKATAKELNLKLVPGIFPIGYSIRYLCFDGNLLSGLPVKDMPFVVKGGKADADPAAVPLVRNGDFEQTAEGSPAGWTGKVEVDDKVKHGGKQSIRFVPGAGKISQSLEVKPFQYYRITFYIKRQGKVGTAEIVGLTGKGQRRLNRTEHELADSDDWQLYTTTINTLDNTEIVLHLGPEERQQGTIWYDDLKIEPAGLLWVLRRDLCPLKVASEDGKTVYKEGEDYKPIADPSVSKKPFWEDVSLYHRPVSIELTEKSRIKDGQKLAVSFYHGMRVGTDQFVISIQDPKVFEFMEKELADTIKLYGADAFFMNYDEIRIGGWELQPEGQNQTPGEMLAQHVKKAQEIIRKQAPKADIYTWSDMFTPYHNARPFKSRGYYYLVNGTWENSWTTLGSDVIIMNWYSPDQKNLKFFSDKGHKQVLAGYYDAESVDGMKANIGKWVRLAEGVPNVQGLMYTTWKDNFTNLPKFFELADTYSTWAKPAATPATGASVPPGETGR